MEISRSRSVPRLDSSDGVRWQIGLAENSSRCAPGLYSLGTGTATPRVQEAVSQRNGRRLRFPKQNRQDPSEILKSSQPLASPDLQAARDNPNHLALGLRHWFGTTLAEGGVPLKTLQEQMGHASIATTMKYYVHAQEESRRQAVRVIGRALRQSMKGEEIEAKSSNFDDIIDDMEGELVGAVNAKP